MKKVFYSFVLGSLAIANAQAQVFSSANVYVGSDAVVTLNSPLTNHGSLQSEGTLHLREGFNNQGSAVLNGQLVLDGTGNQTLEGKQSIAAGSVLLAQSGNVRLKTSLLVNNELVFRKGILENNESALLQMADNAQVSGASDMAHVKGFVQKTGNAAFDFPVGDGRNLYVFKTSAPSSSDKITVGFVAQNPLRLSAKLANEVADITATNYWSVEAQSALQVGVAANQANEQILQLRDNTWQASASTNANNTVSAQTVLKGVSYFTVGVRGTSAESAELADVTIYPNPSAGAFEVRLQGFDRNENILMDITDVNGKSLLKHDGKVSDFSAEQSLGQDVASGSYFLRVTRTEKNQTFVQKILIQK
jgi:Secretion system C-terminal sorting domain